ncbi:MAG: UvrD-helicase domain-containing protein [Nitrospirota bacterium]
MTLSDILHDLNDSQREAVTTTDGPVLVIAGPGTGKTLTIARRISYLVHQGIAPRNILAVTFTNRAAREMQERVASLLGNESRKMFIGTFHVLGLRIMRKYLTDDFVVCDRDGQIEILKAIVRQSRIEDTSNTVRTSYSKLADRISGIKCGLENVGDELKDIYEKYHAALKEKSAFDFDDLIICPARLLENGGPGETCADIFKYIIVDEYQDINAAQYRLLRLLAKGTGNICAVGDPDQAIYAFRGADIDNFLHFERDFDSACRVFLSDNYRSTGTILSSSRNVIKNNLKRLDNEVKAVRERGGNIKSISVPDEKSEGRAIVSEIEKRIGGTSHQRMTHTDNDKDYSGESYSFSDFAVIYRTNAQAKAIEEAFDASGIPYQVIGGRSSIQAGVRAETIEYLKSLISLPDDALSSPHDSDEAGLLTPADLFDPSADTVALMTMHMAKGLEFRTVFIAGVEDGLIPHTIREDRLDIEEERRLFYVGMTRAKDELFLLHSRKRFLYGERHIPSPSPFLKEIPESLMQFSIVSDSVKKKKEDHQMGLF